MTPASTRVLVIGATGRIGRLVVAEAQRCGLGVRAFVRDELRARRLLPGADLVVGDLTRADDLSAAAAGTEAVIFTHGSSDYGNPDAFADVDYGTVSRVLAAVAGRRVWIVLMTSINVTRPVGAYRDVLFWKWRSEPLVRASGQPYTIVRPGWFAFAEPGDQGARLAQGDRDPEGDADPMMIAETLVRALLDPAAIGKTFEVFTASGPPPTAWDALFAALAADGPA